MSARGLEACVCGITRRVDSSAADLTYGALVDGADGMHRHYHVVRPALECGSGPEVGAVDLVDHGGHGEDARVRRMQVGL
eukprot:5798015-Pyramimonas_sp.AAC.1